MGDVPEPDHLGHRARLRQRLLADADGLLDHELIEYLLALAIPRRDTKPLAYALLREFGGIAGLLTAAPEELARRLAETKYAHLDWKQLSERALAGLSEDVLGRQV